MHTTGRLAAMFLAALAAAAASEAIADPLRVSEVNPRYFTDGTGKAVYLAGTHDGWELQDYAWGDKNPGVLFDWAGFLKFLEEYNHNVIRLWVVEHTKIRDDDPDLTVPMAYRRVPGKGKARDGGDKFDLDQFNEAYFQRLRTRTAEAGERGIYVIVMLFQGWSIEDKKGKVNPWPYHPFHRDNNVNGIDGDVNGDGQGMEMHTWLGEDHAITRRQRAYVRKVIDTVNDLDNVLYEIANESGGYSTEWHYRMIEYIHEYERSKPKQHPVGMTFTYDARKRASNAALFASPAEWVSPNREAPGAYDYRHNPPPADGKKIVLCDTDHLWGNTGKDYTWVWKTFCRGHQPLYMDMWTVEREDAEREVVRRALGHTRAYAERMHLLAMTPRGDLASSGYCLASPGREYLIYAPDGGAVTVDLSEAKGALGVEWLNPRTGDRAESGSVQGGAKRQVQAPFKGDAVLHIAAREEGQ
ncbi:MAG: DUF6298 domain-containing protein [Armatimonadota bacterium]